jgi:hypothetical protein
MHFRANDEHVARPAGTLQQRRGAHLAAHVLDRTVIFRHVEFHVRVRVDQVHLCQRTGPLTLDVQLEQTEAVMGLRRCCRADEGGGCYGRAQQVTGIVHHAFLLLFEAGAPSIEDRIAR